MNTVNNLIFDLDGTIWDARHTVLKTWNEVFLKFGFDEVSLEELTLYTGLEQHEIIMNLLNTNYENACKLSSLLAIEEQKKIDDIGGVLYPDVKNSLFELNKKFNLYIVSNCQDGYIESFLKYYELNNLFIDYESAGKTKKSKEKNIKLLMNRNQIINAVYIGDTEGDNLASKSNNIPFVYAKYGFGNVKSFDYVIHKFSELLSIFNA